MDLSRARNFLLTRESEFRVRVSETDEKMIDKITSGRSFMVAAIAILELAILTIHLFFFLSFLFGGGFLLHLPSFRIGLIERRQKKDGSLERMKTEENKERQRERERESTHGASTVV